MVQLKGWPSLYYSESVLVVQLYTLSPLGDSSRPLCHRLYLPLTLPDNQSTTSLSLRAELSAYEIAFSSRPLVAHRRRKMLLLWGTVAVRPGCGVGCG